MEHTKRPYRRKITAFTLEGIVRRNTVEERRELALAISKLIAKRILSSEPGRRRLIGVAGRMRSETGGNNNA